MRGLTLQQPWASLVAFGRKGYETRSWRTSYRGPIAVHASATSPGWCQELAATDPFKTVLRSHPLTRGWRDHVPGGAVLAVAALTDCVRITESFARRLDRLEYTFGDYTPGRFAFRLEGVCILPSPMPMKGMLGLWTIPPETEIRVLTAAGLV